MAATKKRKPRAKPAGRVVSGVNAYRWVKVKVKRPKATKRR